MRSAPYTGHCRFSPPLDARGGRVPRDGRTTQWWMILDCDPELRPLPGLAPWAWRRLGARHVGG